MAPHQIIAVGIRLFAVWLAIYFLRAAPGYYTGFKNMDEDYAVTSMAIFFVVVALFFLVLWFFPNTIAKGVLPKEVAVDPEPISTDRWFAVGGSLIGLWLLTEAIPALVRYALIALLSRRLPEALVADANSYLNTIYYLVQFFLGVWLLLGAKGLRALILKARYGG
ncbi:MAG: hypothetical protein IPI97_14420 [Nitrosomonas sp.]|nr:hypothetical protein [Nitrosomonas sp.]